MIFIIKNTSYKLFDLIIIRRKPRPLEGGAGREADIGVAGDVGRHRGEGLVERRPEVDGDDDHQQGGRDALDPHRAPAWPEARHGDLNTPWAGGTKNGEGQRWGVETSASKNLRFRK